MLTKKQQFLIIALLGKNIQRKTNKHYSSTAYYKTCNYLDKAGIIRKTTKRDKKVEIHLTLKGEFLAEILASLPDVSEETRRRHGLE